MYPACGIVVDGIEMTYATESGAAVVRHARVVASHVAANEAHSASDVHAFTGTRAGGGRAARRVAWSTTVA